MSSIHFTDEGQGTPLVFIHGYCESLSIWSEFVKPFTKSYRVICIDLPGFGQSILPDYEFGIAQLAATVWDFLKSIDVKTCFVAGHSLGGYVTLEMAHQQADKMKGFCLFHSTAYADDENKKKNRTKVMEFVEKNGTPPFVQTLIPSLFANPDHPKVKAVQEEASRVNPKTVIEYARAMRDRSDRTNVYDVFDGPVLFIAGVKDGVVPLESVWKQAENVKRKKIVELDEVAHMGMLEAAPTTQNALSEFLNDNL